MLLHSGHCFCGGVGLDRADFHDLVGSTDDQAQKDRHSHLLSVVTGYYQNWLLTEMAAYCCTLDLGVALQPARMVAEISLSVLSAALRVAATSWGALVSIDLHANLA